MARKTFVLLTLTEKTIMGGDSKTYAKAESYVTCDKAEGFYEAHLL